MGNTHDVAAILGFLRELRDDNSRDWFEANRQRYEAVRADFISIVGELLGAFGPVDDLGVVAPKDCVFRINRDLRFSKDKTPYKTAMSALLGRDGRKSGARSYYFHLEPDGKSILAGGLYEPDSAQLDRIRRAIAADSKPLKRILARADYESRFGGISGDSLKKAPQGYPKDHPDIELLRQKQFYALQTLSDAEVSRPGLVPLVLGSFAAMKPLLVYLEETIAS